MKRSAQIALVVATTFAVLALAEWSVRADEQVPRVALSAPSDARASTDAMALDRYAGRYHTTDGLELIVVPENDALTIELPAVLGRASLTMRSNGAGSFVTSDGDAHATFEVDGEGNVRALELNLQQTEVIAGVRTPFRRGVVTIHDVVEGEVVTAASI
jgi:Domain of unknown function (DUF3471)